MRIKSAGLTTAVLIATCLTSGYSYAQEPLSVYAWENTFTPSIQEKWALKTGQKVDITHFDNDDERNRLMLNSAHLPYDIVVLDNSAAHVFGQEGKLVKVSDLTNYNNNNSQWNKVCGDYAIPYSWGMLGVAYRTSEFKNSPTSWSILTSPPEKLQGHIGLIEDTVDTLLPSLLMLGIDPLTDSPEALRSAYAQLIENSSHILTFEYPTTYINSNNGEELHAAMVYSDAIYWMNTSDKKGDWAFFIPNEGSMLWVDCLAINTNSSQIESSKAFLNFLLEPEIAAENALHTMSATTNDKALTIMPRSYRENKTLFPSQEVISNAIIDGALSKKNISLRAKILRNLISHHEAKY